MKYSFIIPVFNEEGNIQHLHKEIKETTQKLNGPSEIIFINDGSKDATLEKLSACKPVKIINFRKNYGQSAALDAGIKGAKGDIIITLDGDGQNDPADVPMMIEKLNEGFDVVCGWRKKREDSFSKKFISRGAAFLRSFLVQDTVHDAGCTLRVAKKECYEDIILYGELHRMIPALLRWEGFSITEIPVHHRARNSGTTKYNWRRIIKGFIDMLNIWFWRKYENRPLYFFGSIGIFATLIGAFMWVYLFIGRLLGLIYLSDRVWPLVALFFSLIGVQLFIWGILANIIIKQKYEISDKHPYKVVNVIEN